MLILAIIFLILFVPQVYYAFNKYQLLYSYSFVQSTPHRYIKTIIKRTCKIIFTGSIFYISQKSTSLKPDKNLDKILYFKKHFRLLLFSCAFPS